MAGVPAAISSSGGVGTKKPFTYCPGGINFNELKSPRMARRIAKHQSQMENTQTLASNNTNPSDALTQINQCPPSSVETGTLSNVARTNSKPVYGRQRSITDLLSSTNDVEREPKEINPKNDHPMFSYNPYAADRSISIPPATPPPCAPLQPVDMNGRANSLPPSAVLPPPKLSNYKQSMKPGLPPMHPQQEKSRQGLPPQHPTTQHVEQVSQHGPSNQGPLPQSCTIPKPSLHQDQPRQGQSMPQIPQSQPITQQGHKSFQEQPVQEESPVLATMFAPPPPPPPPPPLGIVARSGRKGVPFAGKKSVKNTRTLADIRANQASMEDDCDTAVVPTAAPTQNTQVLVSDIGQELSPSQAKVPEKTAAALDDLSKSFDEFEKQRMNMLSPKDNINNFSSRAKVQPLADMRPPINVNITQEQPASTCSDQNFPGQNKGKILAVEAVPQSFQNQPNTAQVGEFHFPNGVSAPRDDSAEKISSSGKASPSMNAIRHVTVKAVVNTPNDDINLTRVRESSVPRQTSLQKDSKVQTTDTRNIFTEGVSPPFQSQNSKEDLEVVEINQQDDKSFNSVRYRPPSPRVVTPVRFTPAPKSNQRKLSISAPNMPIDKEPVTISQAKTEVTSKKQDSPFTSTNSSSSFISPNVSNNNLNFVHEINPQKPSGSESSISTTGESEEMAGKIITEQMQKIEAQMKKILESENNLSNKTVETPNIVNSTSTNSGGQPCLSKTSSINSSCGDPMQSSLSGYSTCSEDELKFSDSKVEIPVQNAPFEIMEEFEEAPEEFDLGISSYSIAHPQEPEEVERTPVPEVYDSDSYSTLGKNSTPQYRVTTPSEQSSAPNSNYSTLENNFQKVNGARATPKSSQHQFEPQKNFTNSNFSPKSPRQLGSNPPQNSPFSNTSQFPMFPPMQPMQPMGNMFDQFPSMPSMFESPFGSTDFFKDPFSRTPILNQPPKRETAPASSERVIPIKVVNEHSGLQNSQFNQMEAGGSRQKVSTANPHHRQQVGSAPAPHPAVDLHMHKAAAPSPTPPQHYTAPPQKPPQQYTAPTPAPPQHYTAPPHQYAAPSSQQHYNGSPQQQHHFAGGAPNSPAFSKPATQSIPVNIGSSIGHNQNNSAPSNLNGRPTQQQELQSNGGSTMASVTQSQKHAGNPQQSIPGSAKNSAVLPLRNTTTTRSQSQPTVTIPPRSSNMQLPTLPLNNQTPPSHIYNKSAPIHQQATPPIPSPPSTSQLHNQLNNMMRRKEDNNINNRAMSLSRQSSRDSVSRRNSLINGRETPTFRELQNRYGSPTTPNEFVLIAGKTPLSDVDYQKTARNHVVGELASFGGVQQASKIVGPKRRPSQSPSMRLLGMLHVNEDSDEPMTESVALSKEYTGDQGRYMPPPTTSRIGSAGPNPPQISTQL